MSRVQSVCRFGPRLRAGSLLRRLGLGLVIALVVAGLTAGAAAAADFTWTGNDPSLPAGPTTPPSPQPWSDPGNWAGGVAPAADSTIGTLSLPPLAACGGVGEGGCYVIEDDVPNLTIGQLNISTTAYDVLPDTNSDAITLVDGITTTGAPALGFGPQLNLNVALGGDQTWEIDGGLFTGPLSGDHALTVNIGGESRVGIAGGEIGATSFVGGITSVPCGDDELELGGLNSVDGNAVSVRNLVLRADNTSTGPLSVSGSCVEIAAGNTPPSDGLTTDSATFDATSTLQFNLTGPGATPGVDNGELTSNGSIDLGNARLDIPGMGLIGDQYQCIDPPAGQTYTLVSSAGSLFGDFGNASDGAVVLDGCDDQPFMINYNTDSPTQTVTATAVARSTTTTVAAFPSDPVSDQPVTLVATVTSNSAPPDGTIAFEQNGNRIPGCIAQPVTMVGAAYVATCDTTFGAYASPVALSAAYTPGYFSDQPASTGTGTLTVGRATTYIQVSGSTADPAVGQDVTYTASVRSTNPLYPEAFGGPVEFLDDGTPIASCPGAPPSNLVDESTEDTTCTLSYGSVSSHAITAQFAGDTGFNPSLSSPIQIDVMRPVTAAGAAGAAQNAGSSDTPTSGTDTETATAATTTTQGVPRPQAPTISIEVPANGADYPVGLVLKAKYDCAGTPSAPLASCKGSVSAGSALDTARPGEHTFVVHASDGNTAVKGVRYFVVGQPTVAGGTFSGLNTEHPTLAFTTSCGVLAPGIKSIAIAAPRGFALSAAPKSIHVVAGSKALRFMAHLSGHMLVISLSTPATRAHVTITAPAIVANRGREGGVASQTTRRTMGVLITDAAHQESSAELSIRIRSR
jgi:hypothetical protein